MEPTPTQLVLFFVGLAGALVLSGVLLSRLWKQYSEGRDVVPYRPRRPVPWGGWDVLAVGVLFLLAPSLVHWVWQAAKLPIPVVEVGPEIPEHEKKTTLANAPGREPVGQDSSGQQPQEDLGHQVEQLLRQTRGMGVWLAVVLVTLVAAPVVEEWVFRAVLQGWLEKWERRVVRAIRSVQRAAIQRGIIPYSDRPVRIGWPRVRWLGWGPVVFSSLIFAGLHFRTAGPTAPPEELLRILLCQGLGNLVCLVGGGAFLMLGSGARPADFGLGGAEAWKDIRRGLMAYLVVIGPVYLAMILTKVVLILLGAAQIAPDPVPLFVLALVLGGLYFRTHSLLACIILHIAFNATGLALFLLFWPG
jgi:membrane protease YdiL (CAAX protease family)